MQEGAFTPGEVAIFEGVERAREAISSYYERKMNELAVKEAENPHATQEDFESVNRLRYEEQEAARDASLLASWDGKHVTPKLPEGRKLYTSEPIIDRKSVFVGHAIEIHQPAEVSQVVVSYFELLPSLARG